jgi:diguanylate cyclase (GGDEF)-like protein/PAS domain S-box-containing protein/MYXO-CTERM domain-containing protein
VTAERLAGVVTRLAVAVAAVEVVMLAAWLAMPGAIGETGLTRPPTAVALLALALATALRRRPTWVRCSLAALAATIAVAGLGGATRMPLSSALCLLLLALAAGVGPRQRRALTWATLVAFALAYVGGLGHLYGVTALSTLQTATAMAVPTAPAVLALCAALLLSDRSLPAARAVRSRGTAGAMVRRLLVWALVLPPLVGWLLTLATRHRWIDDAYGLSVMTLASTTGAVLVVLLGARTAARTDRQREEAVLQLAALNAELEARVDAAVAEAEEGRDRLRFLLDRTPVGIFETGPDGVRRFVNQRWRDLAGVPDAVGLDWSQVLHPDDRDRVHQEWAAAVARGDEYATRCRYQRPDGGVSWVDITAVAVHAADGTVTRWLGCVADVTDQVDASAALRRSEEQFRLAMTHAPIGMALVEVDGRFREVNRALCRLVGYDEADLVGRTFQQITHPEDLEADLDNIERLLNGSLDHYAMEKRYITRSGETVWVHLAVSLARDEQDRPAYFVAQIQDITDARAAQERLEHRALHDPLTGLPNRDLLMDHLSHALARSARAGTSTAVMFCDLDHFKAVNDTYGHEAGDLLLVAVAERLRETTRPGDTVARLGGDEFVVVAEGVRDIDGARALADRVHHSLGHPVQVGAHTIRPRASVGVAVASSEDDARSVLREADAAMYRAKALGRGRLEVGAPGSRREPPLAVVRQHPTAATELDQQQA